MYRTIIAILAAGLLGGPALAQDGGAPGKRVLFEDFEKGGGAVARVLLREKALTIVPGEGVGGGAALRAAYVGGPMGSERLVRFVRLGEEGPEYTLHYDVRFDRDFQFVGGGKLHGMGPRYPVAGGDPIRPDGWSARVMWRAEGRPELYTYHQDQKGRYGDHGVVARAMKFEVGRWYAVSLQVKVNDPAKADGAVRLYVDGALIESHEQLRLRGNDRKGALVSQFLFSTFHGGGDPHWAPRTPDGGYATVHAWFDNFAVERGARVRERSGG